MEDIYRKLFHNYFFLNLNYHIQLYNFLYYCLVQYYCYYHIVDYYRNSDADFWKRKQALVKASEPLAADSKLEELKNNLKLAEEPVRINPTLVQLREDAKDSTLQNENKRLTVVQDLTWALVNSPGFLFNH